jgi:hypothetical protein
MVGVGAAVKEKLFSQKRSCLVKRQVTGGGGRHMMGACAAVKKKY